MTFEELIEKMNPEIHQAVKQAVELGKWPDGRRLDTEEKQICLRALIVYENKNLSADQRTGFMSGEQMCESEKAPIKDVIEDSPLKWH